MQHTKLSSAVKKCSCKHKFQDERYGEGSRVMNPCKGPGVNTVAYRCTVCHAEHKVN